MIRRPALFFLYFETHQFPINFLNQQLFSKTDPAQRTQFYFLNPCFKKKKIIHVPCNLGIFTYKTDTVGVVEHHSFRLKTTNHAAIIDGLAVRICCSSTSSNTFFFFFRISYPVEFWQFYISFSIWSLYSVIQNGKQEAKLVLQVSVILRVVPGLTFC